MKSFKKYLEEKEEMNEEVLTVAAAFIGQILGVGALGAIAALGASLIFKGLGYSVENFKNSIEKMMNIKPKESQEIVNEIKNNVKNDELYRIQKRQMDSTLSKFETIYEDLFNAIEEKNEQKTLEELKKIDRKVRNDEGFKKSFIAKASEVFEEPPIHYGPTGNESYKFIKGTLGIQEAKAAAQTVQIAIKKYAKDLALGYKEEEKENVV
jgi:flagellar biosynthesis component FlhA